MYVLPRRKPNHRIKKGSPANSQNAIQLVCNYDSYTSAHVKSVSLKLGQIPDPYEVIQVAPVRSLGEGSNSQWPQAWRGAGKPISEMSVNSLRPQEERDKRFNALNDIGARPGKPLDKGPLSSYQQKGLERASGELVALWKQVKTIHLST